MITNYRSFNFSKMFESVTSHHQSYNPRYSDLQARAVNLDPPDYGSRGIRCDVLFLYPGIPTAQITVCYDRI